MTTTSVHNALPRTKTIHNGVKQELTFSSREMGRRLSGLRALLAERDLDAAVLTSLHNVKYFSDFLYTSFGRSYALVVTASDAVVVAANVDGGMPWRRTPGEVVVYTDWQRGSFATGVAEALRRAGGPAPDRAMRLGIEVDAVTLALRETLGAVFPAAEFSDVAEGLMQFRMVKSEEEIAVIRAGARIGDLGGAAIREAIRPGVSEHELALLGTEVMVDEIARSFPGSELRDTIVLVQAGLHTDGAHNWPTSRRLRAGDLLSVNCFPTISGYYTALERTMHLGAPDARTEEVWNVNAAVHRRGLELIRPGAVCSDIANELNEIFASHGLLEYRTFGYGHSFGVLSHYYGRESGLEFREDVDTVLEAGMVVSMEPMIMIPEGAPGAGGYREHDILVVGETGTENLTGLAFGPEHHVISC